MKRILKFTAVVLVTLIIVSACTSDKKDIPYWLSDYEEQYAENPRTAAQDWFRDAKFGMFVHLNLASLCENGKADYLLYRDLIELIAASFTR